MCLSSNFEKFSCWVPGRTGINAVLQICPADVYELPVGYFLPYDPLILPKGRQGLNEPIGVIPFGGMPVKGEDEKQVVT